MKIPACVGKGRPTCLFKAAARAAGSPRYVDGGGVERFTSSGNAIIQKRKWLTQERRARGVQPRKPKAPPEVLSTKNVANVVRWRVANPDKLSAQRAKGNFIRRSAVRGRVLETIGAIFLKEQREAQYDLCAYCGTFLFGAGHQDHVTPVARGGAHIRKNIVWACEPCNLKKGARLGWVPLWGGK
jgi:hypothetical protein